MSVGAHEALREHPEARLVTGTAHVLEEVGRIGYDLAPPARAPERPRDRLDDEAAQVLEALPRRKAIGVEQVAARARVDLRTAMRKLSMLEELAMVVRRDDGYALAPPPKRAAEGGRPPPDRAVEERQPPPDRVAAGGRPSTGVGPGPSMVPPS
jgi:DNA processing protein